MCIFQPVVSNHGLLTTVAYKMGKDVDPIYALEGSVAVAGSATKWLIENLDMADNFDDLTNKTVTVPNTNGVNFVPAFSGLFAPHWKSDARGSVLIIGLSFGHLFSVC